MLENIKTTSKAVLKIENKILHDNIESFQNEIESLKTEINKVSFSKNIFFSLKENEYLSSMLDNALKIDSIEMQNNEFTNILEKQVTQIRLLIIKLDDVRNTGTKKFFNYYANNSTCLKKAPPKDTIKKTDFSTQTDKEYIIKSSGYAQIKKLLNRRENIKHNEQITNRENIKHNEQITNRENKINKLITHCKKINDVKENNLFKKINSDIDDALLYINDEIRIPNVVTNKEDPFNGVLYLSKKEHRKSNESLSSSSSGYHSDDISNYKEKQKSLIPKRIKTYDFSQVKKIEHPIKSKKSHIPQLIKTNRPSTTNKTEIPTEIMDSYLLNTSLKKPLYQIPKPGKIRKADKITYGHSDSTNRLHKGEKAIVNLPEYLKATNASSLVIRQTQLSRLRQRLPIDKTSQIHKATSMTPMKLSKIEKGIEKTSNELKQLSSKMQKEIQFQKNTISKLNSIKKIK
ncbi:hypothetical protein ACLI07_01530 [Providencia huaxiensis]|uniref:hypothetical protein n=1 Tax=Providencia TaxID=586 RepID=UPI00234AE255|nr:hypothetical protein [Providencia sp. PROV076]